jgi:hypothetical protein
MDARERRDFTRSSGEEARFDALLGARQGLKGVFCPL